MAYGETAHVRPRGAVGVTCRPACDRWDASAPSPTAQRVVSCPIPGAARPTIPCRGTSPEYSPPSGGGPTNKDCGDPQWSLQSWVQGSPACQPVCLIYLRGYGVQGGGVSCASNHE